MCLLFKILGARVHCFQAQARVTAAKGDREFDTDSRRESDQGPRASTRVRGRARAVARAHAQSARACARA